MVSKHKTHHEEPVEPVEAFEPEAPPEPEARKIIHGFSGPTTGLVYIICDDGTLWREVSGDQWAQLKGP